MTTPNPQPTPTIYPDYCHALSPTISRWCPLRAIDVHSLRSVGMYVDSREIYHYTNHPIKWIRLVGVVVAIDEFERRKVLTVDDSSGSCIECVCAVPAAPSTDTTNPSTSIPNQLDQFKVQITAPTKSDSKTSTVHKSADREGKNGAADKETEQPSTKSPQIPWDEIDVGSVVKIKGQVGKWWDVKQIDVVKIDIIGGTELEVKAWDEMLAFRRDILSKLWAVTGEEEEKCRKDRERSLRKGKSKRGVGETAEMRKRRKEQEQTARDKEKQRKMDQERGEDEDVLDRKDKVKYPPVAVRRRIVGKYDSLGI